MSPANEKTSTTIVMVFALVVVVVCVASFFAIIIIKARNPNADVTVFVQIFLVSFSFITGVLTGRLGLP